MARKRHRRTPRKRNRSLIARIRAGTGKPGQPIVSLSVIGLFIIVWMFIRYEPVTAPDEADVIVYVSASCSCYRPWVRDLRRGGLAVGVVQSRDVVRSQAELGVPREFAACHTAVANGYWIEGHVPAGPIASLLTDPPTGVAGLAHLRAERQTGDDLFWEVVTYDAEGEPILSVPQMEESAESDGGTTHEQ